MGIHLLLIRFLRPTTALSADEQSDTHVMYCCYTRKCAMKVWLTSTHTTGYTYSAYPWHQLRIVLGTQSSVVISGSQSTKHRVTLFPLCSALPDITCSRQSFHRTDALQNYENILNNCKSRRKYRKILLKKMLSPFASSLSRKIFIVQKSEA